MNDILKLTRVQAFVLVLFVFIKATRPMVLRGDAPDLIKVFFLSAPNFCEAVMGVMLITALLLIVNVRFLNAFISLGLIYALAVLISGIYVITQEVKIHNLGGNNIYDPNDVLFSVVGLVVGYVVLIWLKPKYVQS